MLLPGTKKEDFLEGQFAYPGDKEGGLPGGPVCLSRGQRRRTSWKASLLMPGQRRRTSWRASLLIPGTKKEDFLEGHSVYLENKEGGLAYPGDKEGGLPGGPVCFSRKQRRRTSWRASLLILKTKKEDFLEGQFLIPGTKKQDFLEGQFDKEGGLPGGPVCLSRGQRRRTSPEGQFAYPRDKEGGLPGGPVCLSRGQRRRTSWRASLLIRGQRRRTSWRASLLVPGTKKEDLPGGPVC